MRHLHSEFHFRHALFALQGPEGYVDALLESARGTSPERSGTFGLRRSRPRSATTECASSRGGFARAR